MKTHDTNSPPKKAYQSPQLLVYGDIRKITAALSTSGAMDGGGGGMKTA